jgi:predicted DNA-binding antitoxin AbrB/MazE fold protein
MVTGVEAIYEDGVLKLAEPLPLADKQRVMLTVNDLSERMQPPKAEMLWIGRHGHLYKGEWLALRGSELISHGLDGNAVRVEALSKGVQHPLMYHVPDYFGEFSIEWF